MVQSKPDCTGQRFGRLVVKGRGSVIRKPSKFKKCGYESKRTWILECDCGNTIELVRGDFDKKYGRRSCGRVECQGRKGKQHANAAKLAGRRFGCLVAIERIPGKFMHGHKPVWLCKCDCGATVERSTQQLGQGYGKGVNCGNRLEHGWGLWYPPTPSPYPPEAGELVSKYLYLTKLHYERIDQEVEDEKIDWLIRAAWVITYRRSKGETFTELGEKRFISKYFRYSPLIVYWRRKIAAGGGIAYKIDGQQKKGIGGEMTDLTSSHEAVDSKEQTQPGNCIPIRRKHLRFKRC